MTELENVLPFSGIDPRGRVKFSVLLEMFQQMADTDASKYGLSVRQTLENNITWVLRKYRVDLERYPTKESGNLTIKTYAEIFRNLFSLRSFKLRDSRGGFLGSAYTWWVLLDVAKQRPIRLDKCELVNAFRERFSDELPADVKVPEATAPAIEELWKVRWQDLDVNDHTNHAVYFSWVLDSVPDEVPEKMVPSFVEGEYLHPIPRTRVRCLTQEIPCEDGRAFLHSLRHAEDETEYAKFLSRWR
ncbi:MAG: thioesterase [Synergistaceae bacterium]|nr:thioesterase [Synergistaceae bacterium]